MRVHHIAYVTKDALHKADRLCKAFGFRRLREPLVDPQQGVRIVLLDIGGGIQLELLEPVGDDSPVRGHLRKGGGLYHLCFAVDELDAVLERLEQQHAARVIKAPLPAPAFDGRRVAFVFTADCDVVEFVEEAAKPNTGKDDGQ